MVTRLYGLLLKALMILSLPCAALFAGPAAGQRGELGADSCSIAVTIIRVNLADAQDLLRKAEGLIASAGQATERDTLRRVIAPYRTRLGTLQNETGDVGSAAGRLGCTRVRELSISSQSLIAEMRREEARIRLYVGGIRRIHQMIRRTDASLYRASQMVRRSDADPESFISLRRAFELQEDAKRKLTQRDLDGALRTTIQARLLIAQTMAAALDSIDVAELKDEARQFYDKTNDMISDARTCITAAGDPRGVKLLALAREHQERAREAVDARDPAKAIRNARAARKIVNEINRLCQRAKGVDNRIDRLDAKLALARQSVESSGNRQAQQILDKGKEHAESAKRAISQGHAEQARIEADIAAKLIAKAVDVAQEGNAGGSDLAAEVRKTQAIVDKARSSASTEEQRTGVAKAQELVDQARGCKQDSRQCMALLDNATDLAIGIIAQRHRNKADRNADDDQNPEMQ